MKKVSMQKILILLFLLPASLMAQKTQVLNIRNIDCKYDTTASIYPKSDVLLTTDAVKNIELTDGNKKILFLRMYSTECNCNDCSESNEIAVQIDSLQLGKTINLNSKNATWVYWNSWADPKFITAYLGNITQVKEHEFEIKLSELLGGVVIRTMHLRVRTDE
jgi:hypothetical protein